jgi:Colicin immunity protein / pyocin immunity protein
LTVNIIIKVPKMTSTLTQTELVELVTKIMECEGSEQEIDKWINTLKCNVTHPEISNLIFYPSGDKEYTPEEIVDIALNYNSGLLLK